MKGNGNLLFRMQNLLQALERKSTVVVMGILIIVIIVSGMVVIIVGSIGENVGVVVVVVRDILN